MAARDVEKAGVHRNGPQAKHLADQRKGSSDQNSGSNTTAACPLAFSNKLFLPVNEPLSSFGFGEKQHVETIGSTRQQHSTSLSSKDYEMVDGLPEKAGQSANQSSGSRNQIDGASRIASNMLRQSSILTDKMFASFNETGSSTRETPLAKTIGGTRHRHSADWSPKDNEVFTRSSGKRNDRQEPGKYDICIDLEYRTDDGINAVETRNTYDVCKYMKWKFVLNSPTLLKECEDQFMSDFKIDFEFSRNCKLVIRSKSPNEAHAQGIVKEIIDFATDRLVKDLVVDTFKVPEERCSSVLDRINILTDAEKAYAEVTGDTINVVFRESDRQLVKKIIDEYALTSNTEAFIEEKVTLKKSLFHFTSVIQESKEMKQSKVVVRFEQDKENLVYILRGTPDSISNAKLVLDKFSKALYETKVNFSPLTTLALQYIHVQESITDHLKKKYPKGTLVALQLQNSIYLYGLDRTEVDSAKRYVCQLITEKQYLLTGDLRKNVQLVTEHFNNMFNNRVNVHVDSACRLYMVGLKEAIVEASAEFLDIEQGRKSLSPKGEFAHTQKDVTQHWNIQDPLHLRFLAKSTLLKNVSETFQVNVCPHEIDCTISINGSDENVTRAFEHLCKIETSISTDRIDISDTESVKYFSKTSSDELAEFYMANFDVLLDRTSIMKCENTQIIKEPHINNSVWHSGHGKMLVLEKMNLESVEADVKIVPTKCDLSQGGMFKIRKDKVVEMAVPDFRESEQSVQKAVEQVIDRAIEKSVDENFKSFAILLSPVGSWNVLDPMRCMVNMFVDWLLHSPKQSLISIIICMEDEACFFRTDEYIDGCLKTTMRDANNGKVQPEIRVVTGRLDQAQADVIVNTAASNLDLSFGKVSAALSKAAGKGLQIECRDHFPNGISHDVIAVTDGYKLKCEKVFHITLQAQNKSEDILQNIRNAMELCMKTASNYKYRSIAFPAIGTGSLRYPTEVVASEMFMSIERFINGCLSTTIQEIQFVIHPKDTDVLQTFRKMRDKLVKPKSPSLAKSVDVSVRLQITGMNEDVKKCKKMLESRTQEVKKGPCRDTAGAAGTSRQLGQESKFSLSTSAANKRLYMRGSVAVNVYEADILNVPVECIVNAANGDLQHCGGIARAIAKAAGQSLVDECQDILKKKGTIPVTGVACTAPGNLPYKSVLHAVGPKFKDYRPVTKLNLEKCAQDLKQTVLNCLKFANKKNIHTIALPAISSGIFGVPEEVCAIQYAHAVMEFCSSNHSLNEIHFVDTRPNMIDVINRAFDAMIRKGKPAPFDTNIYIEQDTSTALKDDKRLMKNTARDRPTTLAQASNDNEQTEADVSYTRVPNSDMRCTFALRDVPDVKVQIYEGDITNLSRPEAVVCSDNRAGEAKGIVARLLLEKGGTSYSEAKASEFASRPSYGDVITTTGGSNAYTWIMHAIVSRTDPNSIALLYRKVLEEIQLRKFSSVAIPLLGTGVGSIDPRRSTEMLFDQLIHICKTKRKKAFTLHVVLNDKTVSSTAKDVFKRRIDCLNNRPQLSDDERSLLHLEQNILRNDGGNAIHKQSPDADEDCVICMDKVTNARKLKCGHQFCTECIEGYFRVKQVCPTCGQVCGIITGDQPDGIMQIYKRLSHMAGFDHCKSIAITYRFRDGIQGPDHPRPGSPYKGIVRTAYLPDNKEGREVCTLLKLAFERRLVFTIGTSRTTGKECVITWNDIHHKTDPKPNTQFGYPDKTYLSRVREELGVKGVTVQDTEKQFLKELEKEHFIQSFTAADKI